jgi:hypothetical protein
VKADDEVVVLSGDPPPDEDHDPALALLSQSASSSASLASVGNRKNTLHSHIVLVQSRARVSEPCTAEGKRTLSE